MLRKTAPTYGEALQAVKKILKTNRVLDSQGVIDTESEQLVIASLRSVTGKSVSRLELFLKIKDPFPSQTAWEDLLRLSHSRAAGQPLQYLTGVQVFLDHEYQVGPGVLVPRPETEILLLAAVAEFTSHSRSPSLGFEVGIGSGILSIELLCRYPNLTMIATEFSLAAEKFARANSIQILGPSRNGEDRLKILRVQDPFEVLEPFAKHDPSLRAEFLISNPPYLVAPGTQGHSGDEVEAQVVDHEPAEALFAPPQDALYFYRRIADYAERFLQPEGFVFAEIPHERASAIANLFRTPKWEFKLLQDLNQRDRVLVAKLTFNSS